MKSSLRKRKDGKGLIRGRERSEKGAIPGGGGVGMKAGGDRGKQLSGG